MPDNLRVLYYALIAFITINSFLSFFLWRYTKKSIYSKTLFFWLFQFINLGMQFFYPSSSENEIVMVYGLGNISTILAYAIYCELFKTEPKYKLLLSIVSLATLVTLSLLPTDLNFTFKALPYAASVAFPLILIVTGIFLNQVRPTTLLEKFLGLIFILWIIHSFNFAFFRMTPDAPMYGWMTTYALFDLLGIILPAISIEEHSSTEKKRLKALVEEKTQQLSTALDDKELLLKILIHDISNPLTVMKWYLQFAKKEQAFNPKTLEKIIYSQELVEDLVNNVRLLQVNPQTQNIKKLSIIQSIEEMKFIFSKQITEKNITLFIDDQTNGNAYIYADQSSFNHNVLSNFTSNAIKFSPNGSKIIYKITKSQNSLELVIQDSGSGMCEETVQRIMNAEQIESTRGTQGEMGTGLGLGIARSVLNAMGADFNIISREDGEKGTKVIINFILTQA